MGTLRESIMAWEEPRRWVYRVNQASLPLFRALMEEWTFDDLGATTRVQWTFSCDPYPWFGLALRIAPGALERTFDRAMKALAAELAR